VSQGNVQIVRLRHCVVIQKVDELTFGFTDCNSALHRWLPSARDNQLEVSTCKIQIRRGWDSEDLLLTRPGRYYDGDDGRNLSHWCEA
jgi:hypothetical protein